MRYANLRDSLKTLKRVGVPVGSVIDVGIQHSTPFLIEAFPDLHHTLFEPVEEYYEYINRNYASLSYRLVPAAVSDVEGELTLQTEKKTRGDEISHSYLTDSTTESSRKIQSVTLDGFLEKNRATSPYLLKIDVEGVDVPERILKGAVQTLKATSVVIIEMTVNRFVNRSVLLNTAGFDLWDICDLCYYGDCLWQVDAVFVRGDIKRSNAACSPIHQPPYRKELWQGA